MAVVYKTVTRVRCDIHPCKTLSKYSIGPEGRRQLAFNVCEEHAKQIYRDLGELLHPTIEAEPSVDISEPDNDVYTCKYCGTTFPKTKEGKSEHMRHCKVCPSRPVE